MVGEFDEVDGADHAASGEAGDAARNGGAGKTLVVEQLEERVVGTAAVPTCCFVDGNGEPFCRSGLEHDGPPNPDHPRERCRDSTLNRCGHHGLRTGAGATPARVLVYLTSNYRISFPWAQGAATSSPTGAAAESSPSRSSTTMRRATPTRCPSISSSIDNPANGPRFGKTGGISDTQACTDDDPRCDFDGGVSGSFTFHVRVCANNSELTACTPGTRLASWELRAPSVNHAATRPAAAAVRDAFLSVVPRSIVGTSQTDVCSSFADIRVPLRGSSGAYAKGHVTVKTSATLYDGRTDADKLRLECRP